MERQRGDRVPGEEQARWLPCGVQRLPSGVPGTNIPPAPPPPHCSHGLGEGGMHFSSVQSCPTLCDPMDYSTPDLPVHHQLPELTQAHVHLVGDAIQPSHPLSCPSPPAFNLSQHQGLFQ